MRPFFPFLGRIGSCALALCLFAACSSAEETRPTASAGASTGEGSGSASSSTAAGTGGGGAGGGSGGEGGGIGGSGGDATGGGSGNGGDASSSTTGPGSGPGGGGPECKVPEDCVGADTDCQHRTCKGGVCGVEAEPAGKLISSQTAGDCKKVVCDGAGSELLTDDPGDAPDDGNDCTVDVCTAGIPSHAHAAAGVACAQNGGKLCNGFGVCVECLANSDCTAPEVCDHQECIDAACVDKEKNGDETDIDCGGPICKPCADELACLVDKDCLSGLCVAGHCAIPTCEDGVENGGETDIDCGGPFCDGCGAGKECLTGADCTDGACSGSPGVCVAPSCNDSTQNGGETDVDCGGPDCPPCGSGKTCALDSDCVGGICHELAKTCDPTCNDGEKNGGEGDVDCGGPCLKKCEKGKSCHEGSDCETGVCTNLQCK